MATTVPATGGLVIARPAPLVAEPGTTRGLSLISDPHFGSADQDRLALAADLDEAAYHEDRVLIGGDVFDLLLPGDRKRYSPARVDPDMAARGDLQNAQLEAAVSFFAPYADLIDGIGVGNHEAAAEKAHSVDLVRLLLAELGRHRDPNRPPIQYLGYTAYVSYPLVTPGGRKKGYFTIWYHHGSKGAATAHGAMGALLRKSKPFQADLYWSGHHHVRAHQAGIVHRYDPAAGRVGACEIRHVLTGSYVTVHGTQDQEDYRRRGRKSNYAADEGFGGGGVGGARVLLSWHTKSGPPSRVRILQ